MFSHLWIVFLLLVLIVGSATMVLLWVWRDKSEYYPSFTVMFTGFTLLWLIQLLQNYILVNVDDIPYVQIYISFGASTLLDFFILGTAVWFFHRFHGLKIPVVERTVAVVLLLTGILMVSSWGVTLDLKARTLVFMPGHFVSSLLYSLVFTYLLYVGLRYFRKLVSPSDRYFEWVMLGFLIFGYVEQLLGFFSSWGVIRETINFNSRTPTLSAIPYFLLCIYLLIRLFHRVGPVQLPSESEGSQQKESQWTERYTLTKREIEVTALTLLGLTNQEIAHQLHISLATVKTHLHKIFSKVEVKSRFELARKLSS